MNIKKHFTYFLILLIINISKQERDINVVPETVTSSNSTETTSLEEHLLTDQPTKSWIPLELDDDFLLLSDQLPSCFVMDRKCFLSFLVKDSVDFSNFEVKSSDENKIKIKYIELCKNFERHEKCKEIKRFIGYSKTITIYVIHLEPVNFGNASLLVGFDINNSTLSVKHYLNHSMIISQPARLEDTIFNYYSFVMQTLMSLCMGISMDSNSFISHVRHPKPFLIGFGCQLILMPMVIEHFYFFL